MNNYAYINIKKAISLFHIAEQMETTYVNNSEIAFINDLTIGTGLNNLISTISYARSRNLSSLNLSNLDLTGILLYGNILSLGNTVANLNGTRIEPKNLLRSPKVGKIICAVEKDEWIYCLYSSGELTKKNKQSLIEEDTKELFYSDQDIIEYARFDNEALYLFGYCFDKSHLFLYSIFSDTITIKVIDGQIRQIELLKYEDKPYVAVLTIDERLCVFDSFGEIIADDDVFNAVCINLREDNRLVILDKNYQISLGEMMDEQFFGLSFHPELSEGVLVPEEFKDSILGNIFLKDNHNAFFPEPYAFIGHELQFYQTCNHKIILYPFAENNWFKKYRVLVYSNNGCLQYEYESYYHGYDCSFSLSPDNRYLAIQEFSTNPTDGHISIRVLQIVELRSFRTVLFEENIPGNFCWAGKNQNRIIVFNYNTLLYAFSFHNTKYYLSPTENSTVSLFTCGHRNNSFLIGTTSGNAQLFSTNPQISLIHSFYMSKEKIVAAAFSHAGNTLIIADKLSVIYELDIRNPYKLISIIEIPKIYDEIYIKSISFSENDDQLLVYYSCKYEKYHSLEVGLVFKKYNNKWLPSFSLFLSKYSTFICFDETGKYLLYKDFDRILVLNPFSLQTKYSIVFSKEQKRVFDNNRKDGIIRMDCDEKVLTSDGSMFFCIETGNTFKLPIRYDYMFFTRKPQEAICVKNVATDYHEFSSKEPYKTISFVGNDNYETAQSVFSSTEKPTATGYSPNGDKQVSIDVWDFKKGKRIIHYLLKTVGNIEHAIVLDDYYTLVLIMDTGEIVKVNLSTEQESGITIYFGDSDTSFFEAPFFYYPDLFVEGLDLRNIKDPTCFSPVQKTVLRLYGAII